MSNTSEGVDCEVWKDIDFIKESDGTCAYQVSNQGRVRRAKEVVSEVKAKGLGAANWYGVYQRKLKPKMLKTHNTYNKQGKQRYSFVSIKDTTYAVHSLVAKTFLSDTYKNDLVVNHKDGNKHNNKVDNLEWITPSDNEQHSYDVLGKQPWNKGTTGLMPKHWSEERKSPYDERNKKIIMDKESGLTVKQLSEKYGLGDRFIYQILKKDCANE